MPESDQFIRALLSGLTGGMRGYISGRQYREEREERERREEEERRWREDQLALQQAQEDRLLSGQRFDQRAAKQASMMDAWARIMEPYQERQTQRQAGREAQREQDWAMERIGAQRAPRPMTPEQEIAFAEEYPGWQEAEGRASFPVEWTGGPEAGLAEPQFTMSGDYFKYPQEPGAEPAGDVSTSQIIQLLRMAEDAPMQPGEAVGKFREMQAALSTPLDQQISEIMEILAEIMPGFQPDEADMAMLLRKYAEGGPNAVRQWLAVSLQGR